MFIECRHIHATCVGELNRVLIALIDCLQFANNIYSEKKQMILKQITRRSHVLCVDTGRSSETAKAHRG
eukprot:TRINITY_DN937_c0_g1_i3.p1 TRINITY_DN937_c0_g1~~TRINITY_DN937_c0_g1_i3.p1  ORF type:complete len:69 (+),score=17.83 TRINITY_DN937_c0_g1_i3:370-576(+)